MKKVASCCIVILGLVAFSLPLQADTLTLDLNYTFSGTSPAGDAPWLTATFEDQGGGVVRLTMDASGLTGSEKVVGNEAAESGWYFNFDDEKDVTQLTFTKQSGTTATFLTAKNNYQADGDGRYDFVAAFESDLTQGATSVYDISGIAGLSASWFYSLSSPQGGEGVYYSAAHVQSIGESKESGWIGAVPLPATVYLVAFGLIGIVGVRRRFQ